LDLSFYDERGDYFAAAAPDMKLKDLFANRIAALDVGRTLVAGEQTR